MAYFRFDYESGQWVRLDYVSLAEGRADVALVWAEVPEATTKEIVTTSLFETEFVRSEGSIVYVASEGIVALVSVMVLKAH